MIDEEVKNYFKEEKLFGLKDIFQRNKKKLFYNKVIKKNICSEFGLKSQQSK